MIPLALGAAAVPWLVFATSAYAKIRSGSARRAFAASLRPMRLVPERFTRPLAIAVTAAEVAIAAALTCALAADMIGAPGAYALLLAGLAAAAGLLLVLCAGVAIAVARGTAATCACFGATARPLGPRHLVRNAILTAITGTGLVATEPGRPDPAVGLVAVLAGAAIALTLIHLDDLIELFAPVRTGRQPIRTRS
jgi:hypothetical protein